MKPLNPAISDWRGKRVWIIGASSGIGAALATGLAGAGAHLVLSARRQEALLELAGDGDMVQPLDATDAGSVETVAQSIQRDWGALDMVIYCAGDYRPMRAWEIDLEAVTRMFQVNLAGVYNVLASALPAMLERGSGGICLVSSVAGYTGLPKALAYGPSKAALINLAEVLYSDLRPRGIGVYLVNPGFVDTRLTRQNDFDMPALTTPGIAAEQILKGLAKGKFEIHFPKRFTLAMQMLARLPDRLRFYLLRKAAS